MKKLIFTLALLCLLPLAARSQSVAVSGTNVLDNTGAKLGSGQWCFGSSCLTVTSGAFSGTVTAATATVTVTGSGLTYLTVPSVTIAGAFFSWDTFTVPSNAFISGIGTPRIACTPGAVYTQTDNPANKWNCTSVNGAGVWNGLPAPGSPATVTVGTTTTLPPGQPAAVVNAGTPSAAILNFAIPTSPPSAWGGAWSSTTTYNTVGMQVSYTDGAAYANLQTANLNNIPSPTSAFWALVTAPTSVSLSQIQQFAQIGTPSSVTQGAATPTTAGANQSVGFSLISAVPTSETGYITAVSFQALSSGSATVLVVTLSGSGSSTTATLVQSQTVTAVAGLNTVSGLNIPVTAGQFIGLYDASNRLFVIPTGQTDGLYSHNGTIGSGTTVGAVAAAAQVQMNWLITQTPLGNRIVADEANIATALAGTLSTTQQGQVAQIGAPTSVTQGPTPAATGNTSFGSTVWSQTPVSTSGILTGVSFPTLNASGSVTIVVINLAVNGATLANSVTVSTNVGSNTFTNLYIPVTAGQYIGLYTAGPARFYFATSGGPGIYTQTGLLTSTPVAYTSGPGDLLQMGWTITTTPLLNNTLPQANQVHIAPILTASATPSGIVNGDSWPCGFSLLAGQLQYAYSNTVLLGMGVPAANILQTCLSGSGIQWITKNQFNIGPVYSGSITPNTVTITDGGGNDANTNTEPIWHTAEREMLAFIVDAGTIDPASNTSGVPSKQFASTATVTSGTGGASTNYPVKGETCSSGPCTYTWSNVPGDDIFVIVEVNDGSSYNPTITIDGVTYTGTWSTGSWVAGLNEGSAISSTSSPYAIHITVPTSDLHTVALTLPTGKTAIEVVGTSADRLASGPQVIVPGNMDSAPWSPGTARSLLASVPFAWQSATAEAQTAGLNVYIDTQEIMTSASPFVTMTYSGAAVAAAVNITIVNGVWTGVTLDPTYTTPTWCITSASAAAVTWGSGTGATLSVTCTAGVPSFTVTAGGTGYDPVQVFNTLFSHPNKAGHALMAQAILAKISAINTGRNSDAAHGWHTVAREHDAYGQASIILMPYYSLNSVMLANSTTTSWIDPGRPGQQTKLQVCSPNGTDAFIFPANVYYSGVTSGTDTPASGKCDVFILTMTGQADSSVANFWYATKL